MESWAVITATPQCNAAVAFLTDEILDVSDHNSSDRPPRAKETVSPSLQCHAYKLYQRSQARRVKKMKTRASSEGEQHRRSRRSITEPVCKPVSSCD